MHQLHLIHLLPTLIVNPYAPISTSSRQNTVRTHPFKSEDIARCRQCSTLDPIARRFGYNIDAVGRAEGDCGS